ncbi:MAG: hypothetical protein ACXWZS_11455 [Gemmatirosa sp.]
MTASAYITHLLTIREAQSLRELREVRQALPARRDLDDAQTRFLRDQLAERELELATAMTA